MSRAGGEARSEEAAFVHGYVATLYLLGQRGAELAPPAWLAAGARDLAPLTDGLRRPDKPLRARALATLLEPVVQALALRDFGS